MPCGQRGFSSIREYFASAIFSFYISVSISQFELFSIYFTFGFPSVTFFYLFLLFYCLFRCSHFSIFCFVCSASFTFCSSNLLTYFDVLSVCMPCFCHPCLCFFAFSLLFFPQFTCIQVFCKSFLFTFVILPNICIFPIPVFIYRNQKNLKTVILAIH